MVVPDDERGSTILSLISSMISLLISLLTLLSLIFLLILKLMFEFVVYFFKQDQKTQYDGECAPLQFCCKHLHIDVRILI